MQNKILPVLIAATLFTCGARAQDAATQVNPPVQQPAPTSQPVPATVAQATPAPNQIIYSPRLPSPAELTSAAAAQGLSVEQINQTGNQVTVVYRHSSGQINTVAYQLLPNAGATTATVAAAPTTVVVPNPAPTVIYETSPSVIYYERPYYPRYYYPPVSLSLGFGYSRGWGHHHHWR